MSDTRKKFEQLMEEAEERQRIVEQNGNDGTHYQEQVKKYYSGIGKRKETPVFSGVLAYFPNAIKEVAKCSFAGQQQHNPEKPLAWDRSKSGDELDALSRHLLDHSINPIDEDGIRHITKVAWRALAFLEKELETIK